jgi:dienelactone hydrolase
MLIIILLTGLSARVAGQNYPSWGNLEGGKYKIGFQTIKVYDSTRIYKPEAGIKYRPLLIHFWYPAKSSRKEDHLPFKHYIALETQRENFNELKPDEVDKYCNGQMDGYIEYGKKLMGGLNVSTAEVLSGPTASIRNATPLQHKFPLIVYAPSFGKSAIQNNIACEYLASHGYIVAAVASAGENSQTMTSDEKGVMAQVKDLEYLVNYLKRQDNIDYSKIGTFGYSWGGFSVIIHQMRNDYVKAVVSWDGSIEYQGYEIAKKMSDFKPQKMIVPFAGFNNKNEDLSEFPFFKSVKGNQKHFYRLKQFEHAEFVSYWNFFANIKPNASSYNVKSYETVCKHTLQFFDNYLKGKKSSAVQADNPLMKLLRW